MPVSAYLLHNARRDASLPYRAMADERTGMGKFRSLSTMGQVALGGSVLYLIFSFFKWQEACVGGDLGICVSRNAWHGWGWIGGIAAIAIIVYEVGMLVGRKIDVRGMSPTLVSGVLSLVLLLATVLKFFVDNEFRKFFFAGVLLILSIVIAAASWMRMKEQGVAVPRPGSSS